MGGGRNELVTFCYGWLPTVNTTTSELWVKIWSLKQTNLDMEKGQFAKESEASERESEIKVRDWWCL